ncbi:hypothetical protein NFJ02_28g66040 [Pycnococcus provasolii]
MHDLSFSSSRPSDPLEIDVNIVLPKQFRPSTVGGLGSLVKSMSMKKPDGEDDEGEEEAAAAPGGFAGLLKTMKNPVDDNNV